MIDVQIVAGRLPELLQESLKRILAVPRLIAHVYIANNTGMQLELQRSDKITVIDNCAPKTFEQNHNMLAEIGSSDYILFLDDDAFIFPGNVEMLFDAVHSDKSILLAGGVNNQTWSRSNQGIIPKVANLEYFRANAVELETVSKEAAVNFNNQKELRLFCPGNFMVTRREYWQVEYGGWDELYKNWNEEIDYILWGYERGLKTVVMPGAWFFHCMSSSRKRKQLLANVIDSSLNLLNKFPSDRKGRISKELEIIDVRLVQQMEEFFNFNSKCQFADFVAESNYYQKISPYLT